MKATTAACASTVHTEPPSVERNRMATGSFVNPFDAQREIDRVNAILAQATALVAGVLLERDRSASRES